METVLGPRLLQKPVQDALLGPLLDHIYKPKVTNPKAKPNPKPKPKPNLNPNPDPDQARREPERRKVERWRQQRRRARRRHAAAFRAQPQLDAVRFLGE